MAIFYAHYDKGLRAGATGAVQDGRLQGETKLMVADVADPGAPEEAKALYELFGPGDVQRLGGAAVTRRFPAPGTSDAETRKLALVEFAPIDLPWRYSPMAGPNPRPWLVLVVGTRAPDEIVTRPDGRVTIGTTTQAGHPLTKSASWAHLHEVDGKQIARIVCPLPLADDTEYLACLVPAYTATGADAWGAAAAVTVDCYQRWSFRTGPKGDFPDLAGKLHKADLAAIEARSGKPFGRAEVTYQPRDGAPAVPLPTAGALRLPPKPADPADAPPPPQVVTETAALTDPIVTPDGRGVVTAPRYDAPFTDPAAPAPVAGWAGQLRGDPRARGAAGLGAWTAIAWQDRIGDAAATLAGDLAIAHDRIRHVALGVEVSRSLWRRRLPPPAAPGADPATVLAAAAGRLAVLAPSLPRLPADTGGTVLDAVAGRTPRLGRALLSSAARRALRPGPARTALAQPAAGSFDRVLRAANTCPPQRDDPAVIRRHDAEPGAVKEAVYAATGGDDQLTARIMEIIGTPPNPGLFADALAALAPGRDGRPDPDRLQAFLEHPPHPHEIDLHPERWGDWLAEEAAGQPCRPVDLVGLADAVAAGIDPYADPPPAARRVLSTLPGVLHIGPVEIEPELDIPLWSFLSERSPDWMLPGVGDLDQHSVVGVATNPAFVQALLTGANQQGTGELRWRNIPLVTRSSPLRKFWQRPAGEYDINPVKGWPGGEVLGGPGLDGGRGAEAVVVFRTPIFRRYPATVVYLYLADDGWVPPAEGEALDGLEPDGVTPRRKDPTFTGTIGPEVTFFGFHVAPSALHTHWVVLEEPPAGYRFYDHIAAVPPKPEDTSAGWAYNRFALPVRVLIGPLL